MQELEIFKNEEFGEIRTITIDNEPWFVGKDVAECFGDSNYRRSLARLDEDEKGVSHMNTPGGIQKMTIINESGLYSLLFAMQPQKTNNNGVTDAYSIEVQERINKLRKFKRWVTSEVLPSIRKHGHYGKTPLKDVVSMIRVIQDNMKQQGATAYEIAVVVDEIMKQHGIVLPGFVIEPETFSLKDAYDMIDFIYSQPRGKGHKKTTLDDYIAYKANMKMLGGE